MGNQYYRTSAIERFWIKVQKTPECWLWMGIKSRGYGQFKIGSVLDGSKRMVYAHRWYYEQTKGKIPEGMHLDHLCRNPACVNPDHLEPVTPKENTNRGRRFNSEKTHCPSGHAYDEANTYMTPNGDRKCRACNRSRAEKHRARTQIGAV